MNIREAITTIVQGTHLTQDEAALVMEDVMTGTATAAQIAAFLTALHIKGETPAELAGMARVLQTKATPIPFTGFALDTCGTGGDGSKTFNISTAVAFVVAGAGITVAKHGNRAMSSNSGSADVLEALGVKINLTAEQVARCLTEAGIGFIFAQQFHPAMRFVAPVRREIGIRTAFNLLGPLINPLRVQYQLIGAPSSIVAHKLANTLHLLGTRHAFVVYGDGGMDELSLSGPSLVFEIRENTPPQRQVYDAADYGFARAPRSALQGGTAEENANIIRAIFTGAEQGAKRDVVLFNAAVALLVSDIADDMPTALALVRKSIDDGNALERLNQLIAISNT